MSSEREKAIRTLRAHQERCRKLLRISSRHTEAKILERALKHAKEREKQSLQQGKFVCSGVFRYPAHLEELRWKRTRDVISRVSPGLDEDPRYLEMLARQAASVEIIIRQEHTGSPNKKAVDLCDRILLGTTVVLDPDAFAGSISDHALVVLSYGLISFLYQISKAVVLSWLPDHTKTDCAVSFKCKTDDIEQVLDNNPYPLELLYKTLSVYLFEGFPRAVGFDPPSKEYHPPLTLLTNNVERFVIAHEYGHALLHQLRPTGMSSPAQAPPSWQKEFEADAFAFIHTILSAQVLDLLPADITLQGAFFSLNVLDMIRKARNIIQFGQEQADVGSSTHPPLQHRIEGIGQLFFHESGMDEGAIKGAFVPSDTLALLWNRTRHRILEDARQGRKLHSIWNL